MGANISRLYQSNRSVKSLVKDNEELHEQIKRLSYEIDCMRDLLEEKEDIIDEFLKRLERSKKSNLNIKK